MQYKCEITTQRKQKSLQLSSDEQTPWTAASMKQDMPDLSLTRVGPRDVGSNNKIPDPTNGYEKRVAGNATTTVEGMERLENAETVNGSGAQTEWSESPLPENVMERTDETRQPPEDLRDLTEIRPRFPAPPPPLAPQISPPAQRMSSSDILSPEEDRMQRRIAPEPNRVAPPMRAIPSRRAGDILVDKFFSEVNELHLILSYNDFMPWYRQWFPDVALDPIKQATLFTVFAFGCKDDINAPADSYFIHAVNAMGPVMVNGCLEAVQALILAVLKSFQTFF